MKKTEILEVIEIELRDIEDKSLLKQLEKIVLAFGTLDARPNDDDTYCRLHIIEQIFENNDVEQLLLIDEILKRFAA